MRIPTVEPSVSINVPSVPETKVPSAIEGAFGENVAQATEGFGKQVAGVGEQMTNLALRMQEQKNKELIAKKKSLYSQGWLDRNYSQEIETVAIGPTNPNDPNSDPRSYGTKQTIERPRGYFLRTGEQVDPNMPTSMIQDDFDLRKSLLKDVNPRMAEELNLAFDNEFIGIREKGIQHTFTETRKAAENTFQNTGKNHIDSAVLSTTPSSLKGTISNIMTNNLDWNNRLGKGAAWLMQQNHDDIERAVWNAVQSKMNEEGLEAAKALLSDPSLKDLIPEDLYAKTEDKLNGAKARIDSVARSMQIETDMNTTLDYLGKTKNGVINWSNVDETVTEANKINPKLGQAIQKLSMLPPGIIYRGTNIDDMSFAKSAEIMFKMTDNKALNSYLLDVIKQSPAGNLSSEKMTILLSLARNQAIVNNPAHPEHQAIKEENDNLQNVLTSISYANPMLSPMMIIDLLTRKFKKNLTGEQLQLEGQKVVAEGIKKAVPEIRELNGIPNKIIRGDEPVETIYNGANQLQEENDAESNATRETSNEF